MPRGELHFFDARGKYADRWERGVEWYEQQFEDASPTDLCGEKTPTYSYLPSVPKKMSRVVPDAKLLWIFRNPVDRAYSNYWHAACAGSEWLSFEEAVRREEARIEENIWKGYVRRSQYIEQVDRFLDYFDREVMHFSQLEDFKEAPRSVLREICHFLGVDEQLVDLESNLDRKNVTVAPRSVSARYLARGILGNVPVLGSLAKKLEYKINRREHSGYPELSSALRAQLERHFAPYNRRLEERVGIDVSVWTT